MRSRREQKQRLEALRSIPFLSCCTAEELVELDGLGTKVDVRSGRVLTREGAPGRECFLVLDGVAAVARAGSAIGSVSRGSFVGELAVLSGAPRSATVVAVSPMCLLVLTAGELMALVRRCPNIGAGLQRLVRERSAVPDLAPTG